MESTAITIGHAQSSGFSAVLDRLFVWTMSAFMFVTVFLPGGTLYGVNFKMPFYLLLIPLALYSMFRRGLASPIRLALMFALPGLLSIWVAIGVARGFSAAGSVRQYEDVVLTFLICWLAVVFCGERDRSRLSFLRLVLNVEATTCLFKAGLLLYAVMRGIPTVELVTNLSTIFGVNLMTMDLGAMFGRVQFISDAIIPASVFLVVRYRDRLGIGSIRASLTVLLLIISVIFGFSRYLWAFTALALVTGLLLGRRDRFQFVLGGLLGASLLFSLPFVSSLYTLRFSSEVAGDSDLIRTEQSVALKDFFLDAPLMGHGFGSYTNAVIREDQGITNLNYSYEEQLFALFGQVGLLGVATLAGICLYYYSDLWWQSRLALRDRLGITLLLLTWLAAGLYNPLLFHPIAAVNYAVFAAVAGLGDDRETITRTSQTASRMQ